MSSMYNESMAIGLCARVKSNEPGITYIEKPDTLICTSFDAKCM